VWCLVEIPLTMFSNSVDDQYIGCSPDNLLKLEKLPVEEKYPETWNKSKLHWLNISHSVGSFDPIYGTVIVAYTVGDELYGKFNNVTREAGKSQDSYDRYAFKDFHFLLTKALQAKSKKCCYQVFRGIRGIHFTVSNNAIVRFGQFASSSLNKTVAQNFSEDTFFSILTCHGVRIDDFSYNPKEEEVLIPPYEKFIVTGYSRNEKGVKITLESSGVFSHWNCGVRN
ncbi:NAD(P)(+)--arginine ADP-ribosyltransferase 2-like, partial [Pseudonaja textilis]|uniref:NAD(P)(+)--arginine ADP-ribosyltransferase 2-like n=1 Tax=Pseudonaja textilis TaxID=8673 RepID=UPI000EAA448B